MPCPAEEPIYKLYRSQYYGYYPPQWRQFPEGWHLKSPQSPNRQEELEEAAGDASRADPTRRGRRGPDGAGGRAASRFPSLPPENERSPFEMDRPDNAGNRRREPVRRGSPARAVTAPPADEHSPFETPAAQAGSPGAPHPEPLRERPSPPGLPRLPDTGSPDLMPPAPPERPATTPRARPEPSDRGPLLAMPDATLPPVEEAGASWPAEHDRNRFSAVPEPRRRWRIHADSQQPQPPGAAG